MPLITSFSCERRDVLNAGEDRERGAKDASVHMACPFPSQTPALSRDDSDKGSTRPQFHLNECRVPRASQDFVHFLTSPTHRLPGKNQTPPNEKFHVRKGTIQGQGNSKAHIQAWETGFTPRGCWNHFCLKNIRSKGGTQLPLDLRTQMDLKTSTRPLLYQNSSRHIFPK